jgi:hypothetical protein
MCQEYQPGTPQETLENLRQPMPLGRKFQLFIRNNWLKFRGGAGCCGNHGEPGC